MIHSESSPSYSEARLVVMWHALQVDFAGRVVTEELKTELMRAVTGTKKARFQ